MLKKEEHENLLKQIADSGGDTANMLDLMQKLRDDFDEREGMLKKYGEKYDGENSPKEDVETEKEKDGVNWKEKYADLERKYKERFFTTPKEVKEETEEDVERDGKKQSFEELFTEREG